MRFGVAVVGNLEAAIVQLGERKIEDLKVPSSILGLGSSAAPKYGKIRQRSGVEFGFLRLVGLGRRDLNRQATPIDGSVSAPATPPSPADLLHDYALHRAYNAHSRVDARYRMYTILATA